LPNPQPSKTGADGVPDQTAAESQMRSIRKSGITALTAAIALSLGAVPVALTVPSILASGEGSTTSTAGATGATSTLTLATTSSKGTVTWSGSDTLTQSFAEGSADFCGITDTPGSADLLELTGTIGDGIDKGLTGVAGFRGGEIGVYELSNASQCFRVDAGSFTLKETLNLALGEDLAETLGVNTEVPLLADSAGFSLTKQPGDLNVTWKALLDGKQQGTGMWSSPKRVKTTSVVPPLIAPKDKAGKVLPFDEVQLTAEAGSFSLTGASFTLIADVDATFCDPDTVKGGSVDGAVNTLTKENATVTYLGNVDGTSSCFGVRLNTDSDEVQFLKPLTVARDAEFIFDIAWELEGAGIEDAEWVPDVTLPAVFIDFELRFDEDGKPIIPAVEHELPFCPSLLFDDSGNLTGLPEGKTPADLPEDLETDAIPGAEGVQYACIGSRNLDALVPFTVVDQIYLIGDANFRR
jgi:hypothetical protein